jgi:ParB/RepB/Spo0J family partition protein
MELSDRVYEIPLEQIDISKFNVRLTDAEIGIRELADNIEKHGLLQPVTLRGSYGRPPYELIVGQRRYLAHELLNRETIRAVFCGDVDDIEAKILSLTENLHRAELNHADKAEAITELYLRYEKDAQQVAAELNLPVRTVREYIKIEEQATPKAKKLLRNGALTKTDLKRVIDAAQGDPEKADRLLAKMPRFTKYEKSRAVTYGRAHPYASAEAVIEQAMTPRIEATVILSLPVDLDKALGKAARQLSLDKESIAVRALSEWLTENGYLPREQTSAP